MNQKNNLLFWKAVALGATLFYVYKVSKENGGSLQGNPMGMNINSDKIINMASHFAPPEQRNNVRKYGKIIVDKIREVQNGY
jgi:hypothetical protein